MDPGSVLGAILDPKWLPNGGLGGPKTLPKSLKIVAKFSIVFSFNCSTLLQRPELLFRYFLDAICSYVRDLRRMSKIAWRVGESAEIEVLDLPKYIQNRCRTRTCTQRFFFFMIFGLIWDAFGEPLGSFFGSKMLRTIMFFLNAFCMLSGSRAGGTQAGSTGGWRVTCGKLGSGGGYRRGKLRYWEPDC